MRAGPTSVRGREKLLLERYSELQLPSPDSFLVRQDPET